MEFFSEELAPFFFHPLVWIALAVGVWHFTVRQKTRMNRFRRDIDIGLLKVEPFDDPEGLFSPLWETRRGGVFRVTQSGGTYADILFRCSRSKEPGNSFVPGWGLISPKYDGWSIAIRAPGSNLHLSFPDNEIHAKGIVISGGEDGCAAFALCHRWKFSDGPLGRLYRWRQYRLERRRLERM